MTTYKASFQGRKVNAEGILYHIETEVTADDEETARIALYERFDHISKLVLEPVSNASATT